MDVESEDDEEFYRDHLDGSKEVTLVELSNETTAPSETLKQQKRKKFVPSYDVQGIYKVCLDELTQSSLGLEVGIDVTGEKPWKKVKKELLYDNIQVLGDDSVFASLKDQIDAYDDDDDDNILFGYILDETMQEDEFYVCLSTEAKTHCEVQTERISKRLQRKLEKAVTKISKPWTSLGSEKEVDENIPKNSRPLIRVEVKSKYPTIFQPKRFLIRNTDEARDGYVKLIPGDGQYNNVVKKKIDASIQAIPEKNSSEAQTIPKFPQNVWTQCSVEEDIVVQSLQETHTEDNVNEEKHPEEGETEKSKAEMVAKKKAKALVHQQAINKLNEFLEDKTPFVENLVEFNSAIDIYNIDYPDLLKNRKNKEGFEKMFIEEYLCFTYFKSQEKYVSAAAWNMMWDGIVAITYGDSALCGVRTSPRTEDEVHLAVHEKNMVIVWSTKDSINPKLYLECDREVKCLSFCPFKGEILVGGCLGGQIIIWDLTDKLGNTPIVDDSFAEKTTQNIGVNMQLGWGNKVHERSVVRPTVVSNMLYDHTRPVTDVSWLTPQCKITKTGHLVVIPEDEEPSLQFLTISHDGNILIWSLELPSSSEIKIKETKPHSRVTKYPSTLVIKESPFKILDGILKPIYKIEITSSDLPKTEALSSISLERPKIEFILCSEEEIKRGLTFKPKHLEVKEGDVPQSLWLGSMYGDFIKISWEGLKLDTEKPINSEQCKFVSRARIHDGPVVCSTRNAFCRDILATVGGKVLAIWSDNLKGKPLIWKKMRKYLTFVIWSQFKASQLFVATEDGFVDVWDFLQSSDKPIKSQNIAGYMLTSLHIHKLPMDKSFLAIGDSRGSLRLFHLPKFSMKTNEEDIQKTKEYFKRELEIKKFYNNWQKNWNAKHTELIEARKATKQKQITDNENDKKTIMKKKQDKVEHDAGILQEEKTRVVEPEEKWRRMQWRYVEKIIQEKKGMDKVDLLKQEKPLRDLEAHRINKMKNLEELFKQRQNIFDESVAILFPEAVPKDDEQKFIIPEEEVQQRKMKIVEEYSKIAEKSRNFIKLNPYKCSVQWEELLMKSKNRNKREKRNVVDDVKEETKEGDVQKDMETSSSSTLWSNLRNLKVTDNK